MRKLKDKIWKSTTIKIERMVAQEKDGGMTTSTTKYWLVDVKYAQGNGFSFMVTTPIQLWARLMQEVLIH